MTDPGARDLQDYSEQYRLLPFEPVQAAYRRRLVLARVGALRPARVLEVGCADRPLFVDVRGPRHVVVEPTEAFVARARAEAADRTDVLVVPGLLEEVRLDELGGPCDLVVVAGLLHEVPDPARLLGAARAACAPGGVVHVSVPNARSLHRLLAVAMGLIPTPDTESENQRVLQQRAVYDAPRLEAELAAAGLRVRDRGSLLVKPFTHAQMQRLVDSGFLTAEMLDGLDRLAVELPGLGSEIWVDAEPVDA
ncbi:2-polyprenyl-3-methyl-5-hydroxy-6-metoxy-1,4-benzoquinol methylase [Klenkia marina]|uniref:2-polyprenyl-3-methyl-5-hydroxy-6-metoxy-1,4-benzoquinol methylase n=1 Tax=Klenkia marina TaxID=1960309 RepID=A0A1G4XAN5_9ACTN|nr:methyltransferase domain-containing protein [Klenkia marina]SCX38293.1 2-polyprenyl-3-methyl-5-hydroxy-6-metoxy-1,4-benzoquinol methylase [Klenkia marina]